MKTFLLVWPLNYQSWERFKDNECFLFLPQGWRDHPDVVPHYRECKIKFSSLIGALRHVWANEVQKSISFYVPSHHYYWNCVWWLFVINLPLNLTHTSIPVTILSSNHTWAYNIRRNNHLVPMHYSTIKCIFIYVCRWVFIVPIYSNQ